MGLPLGGNAKGPRNRARLIEAGGPGPFFGFHGFLPKQKPGLIIVVIAVAVNGIGIQPFAVGAAEQATVQVRLLQG